MYPVGCSRHQSTTGLSTEDAYSSHTWRFYQSGVSCPELLGSECTLLNQWATYMLLLKGRYLLDYIWKRSGEEDHHSSSFLKFSFFNFWLPWVSIVVHSLSVISAHRLLLCSRESRLSSGPCVGLSSCGMWELSSLIGGWTYVPCIGKRVFNHWATREVSPVVFQL